MDHLVMGAAFIAALLASGLNEGQKNEKGMVELLLDVGHGGNDPGAIWNDSKEKDLVLSVAKQVQHALFGSELNAQLTRSGDNTVDLPSRIDQIRMTSTDYFVSLHADVSHDNTVSGMRIYYAKRLCERAGQTLSAIKNNLACFELNRQSYTLARLLEFSLPMISGEPTKIRKSEIWILKHSPVPAVLIEIGFMSSESDREAIEDVNFGAEVAMAIQTSILRHCRSQYRSKEGRDCA